MEYMLCDYTVIENQYISRTYVKCQTISIGISFKLSTPSPIHSSDKCSTLKGLLFRKNLRYYFSSCIGIGSQYYTNIVLDIS